MKKKVIALVLVLNILASMGGAVWGIEVPEVSVDGTDYTVVRDIVVDPEIDILGEIEKVGNTEEQTAASEEPEKDDPAKVEPAEEATEEDPGEDNQPESEQVAAPEPISGVGNDGQLKSNKLTIYATVVQPKGNIIPGNVMLNVFSENDVWLHNSVKYIDKAGEYVFEFNVPEFVAGTKFKVYLSEGAEYIKYGNVQCRKHQYFVLETPAASDVNGNLYIADMAGITVAPMHSEMWEIKAEQFVNSKNISSKTSYMIWVSKQNFTVSVFAAVDGKWDCIDYFPCSIGAPNTPTVVGQYEYIQYQDKWHYGTYYVGPIMRFYRGYAIHSTLVRYDGTDYDGRTGKMISHGCVRVRPEKINWLVSFIPMNTRIYVTNE